MKFDVTSTSVREFADRVVMTHPGIDKPQALEIAAHGFGYRNFDTLSGVLKKTTPKRKASNAPFHLDQPVPLWIEGFVCENEYAVFEWAKVTLTEVFLARIRKLRELCTEAGLLHLSVADSPADWHCDEEFVIHDWQLYVSETRFWFRGHPKHASFAVETRAVNFDDLFKLLKSHTEEDADFRWIGGELYKDSSSAQHLFECISEQAAGVREWAEPTSPEDAANRLEDLELSLHEGLDDDKRGEILDEIAFLEDWRDNKVSGKA